MPERNFNPIQDIPTTDEEAVNALRFGEDELFGSILVGIFRCRRAAGQSLLEAYEAALLAAVGESQKAKKDA